ncbi:beta-lactamase/transpeptidase-like protein [Dactylonectria estremocensis]|uniref:Beta-lactamase/transpeptidase-like protein n=1 Tax=Dactylonectria estremocensis TaxID=1079267 RepID=A0A9P9DGC8_9HYPO|nr:beta-lactamase/transpeptidase-like protein [Dactylonectria estremocensis]
MRPTLSLLLGFLLLAAAGIAPATLGAQRRLQETHTQIIQICDACGVPGVSVGVVHHGEQIFTLNHGFGNVQKQQPVHSDTVYGIGALTNSFVAAGLGKLVFQEDLDWNKPVCEILQGFRQGNKIVGEMTIADILSHRTGLSGTGDMALAFQGDGDILLPKDRLFPLFRTFPTASPLRTTWDYFVWGYSLAGEVIEELTNKTLGDFLSESLFKPLKLQSTTFKPNELESGRLAEPYTGLSNGDYHHLPKRQVFENTFFEATDGLYSSLNDMISWSITMLDAIQDDASSHNSIVKEAQSIVSSYIPIGNTSLRERSYGYGWLRTQLPGPVGLVGGNANLWTIHESPILGTKDRPALMLYHQGNTVGYQSFIALFPDTNSSVVVLTNSFGVSDAADWISRVVIQALFELKDGQDYVSLAKEANRLTIADYELLRLEIVAMRDRCTEGLPAELKSYTGTYVNCGKQFSVDIILRPGSNDHLSLRFQGFEDQTYELRHLCGTTFEWSLTHDESKKRGRYNNAVLSTYFFTFEVEGDGMRLYWANDPIFPEHKLMFERHDNSWPGDDTSQRPVCCKSTDCALCATESLGSTNQCPWTFSSQHELISPHTAIRRVLGR